MNQEHATFEAVLEYLRRQRGFDFTAYKRSSLVRRIQKRVTTLRFQSFEEYLDYLEVHPDEFGALFNTILINVTAFFRDPPAWEYIQSTAIPRLLDGKADGQAIRVWSAGCASGEEAYTLAILLAESLGMEQFRHRVKIYATDIDAEALNEARQAVYREKQVEEVPPDLLDKYFERNGDKYIFNRDLRRSVIFGRHDLIHDAPISHIDLLACRNTLMYFNAEAQNRIVNRFFFALNDGGILFLGKAEMLFAHQNIFAPLDLKRRAFITVSRANIRERLTPFAYPWRQDPLNKGANHMGMRDAAFEADAVAQIVVDSSGVLALANDAARTLLNITPQDIHKPLRDLEMSHRISQLLLIVEKACTDRQTNVVQSTVVTGAVGEVRTINAVATPLLDAQMQVIGAKVTFADVTAYQRLEEELRESKQELETAYEELQSTNEELETTNEELQSTVEELETTNEELQSSNEELETMNEELQSTNEELQTMNDELRLRSGDLNEANEFLGAVLSGLQAAVIVIQPDLRIQVWNLEAEKLWGLRSYEVVGTPFLELDIGLDVERLRQPVEATLAGAMKGYETTMIATNRRGKPIECRITCSALGSDGAIRGAMLHIDQLPTGNTAVQ